LDKLEGAKDLGAGISSAAEDAALVIEARRNCFASARELKAAINFPGQ
jgi:hypothetical protein